MTESQFIVGAPMRPPSHFIGPLCWWSDSLTCGGVERQIVASARFFQQKGKKVTLLCRTISSGGGNDFFLEEANKCCRVLGFSPEVVDRKLFEEARRIVISFIENYSPVLRDSIAAYAAWLLRVRPRLLQIWNADHITPLLAAVIAGVPRIIVAGQSLSPAQRAPYGFESVDDQAAFAIFSNIMRDPHVAMTNNSRAGCVAYEEWLGLPPGTVRLTPNVFDLEEWPRPSAEQTAALRKGLGIPEHARVLGGLFRFVSIKDPELWVSTAARACADVPDLYAVVGGHGPELESLRALVAETPFAGRVLFPGPIRDVPAFLSMCSVFLHTAHVEGLPNVLLEAQAYEVPVVTTRCGGAADVVEHGKSGFVVDERDTVVLATHVEYLLGHQDFAHSAGQVGRRRVAENFSQERTGEMLWSVSRMALEEAQPFASAMGGDAGRPSFEPGKGAPAACSTRGNRPLVSFFAAGRNVQEFVEQAMRSMLNQTVDDFELLMLDDGSMDKTYDVMMGVHDSRVKVLRNTESQGIARSLNRLMAQCKGRYWAHMDADDICVPQRLEMQIKMMRTNRNVGVCSSHIVIFRPSGESHLSKMPIDPDEIKTSLLFMNPLTHPFVMYDGELFSRLGITYSEKMQCSLDYDLYLRIFLRHPEVVFANVDQVLGFYRKHEAQISSSRRQEQAYYAFRAQTQVFQALGIAPTNRLMAYHRHFFHCLAVDTAKEMDGLVDWAVTLRMANAAKKLFSPRLFDMLLYDRLVGIMQRSPQLAEPHLWRLRKWAADHTSCDNNSVESA